MNKFRYIMFVVTVFLVLTLSAINVMPALADDTTPPPTEPAQAEEEALPASEEPASVSEDESVTIAEVIESLPEDTELVVVNESGEALPLATQEAAQVIATADPQWCPVGVAPSSATCSGVKPAFNGAGGLIEWLDTNNPNKAGVIWIEDDYDSTTAAEGGAVILDGADYGTMNTFALTINGGWVSGTTLNPNDPSVFNVPFQIEGWLGALTIKNILIEGASGAGTHALRVITNGNISVNNVDVQGNTTDGGGAVLANNFGTGNVIVNDSTFNDNTGINTYGLEIYSNGTVTLKNVTANGNTGVGAYIENGGALTPKAVTLNGTNHFSYNGLDGLRVITKGIIALNNVTAMGNTGGSGAYLDNCDYNTGTDFCNVTSAAGVTIKGTNNFSDNGWDGLRVSSGGVISVSNITANGNGTDPLRPIATNALHDDNAFGKGAYLDNYGAVTPKNITLTGTNTFNGNASNGLTAVSFGMLSVSNLTASENQCDPLFEDGTSCAGAYIDAPNGVTLTGFGRFENNANSLGLILYTFNKGAVTLNNLYAYGNGLGGAVISGHGLTTPVNITLNGSNTFNNNGGAYGLLIDADGAITLNNLTANNNNTGSGVEIYGDYGFLKPVTIKGVNTFNSNGLDGLSIETSGAIITYALTAFDNMGFGAHLINCGCFIPTTQAVTLNGNNYFADNDGMGLYIESNGVITINNLTSVFNSSNGVYLDNAFTNPANPAVTVKGFAYVSSNAGNAGLEILSHGAVTLANVTANSNNSYGVYIDNTYNLGNPLKPGNITITGNNIFNANTSDGLFIFTYGTVLLNNLTANDNIGGGVSILNQTGSLVRPVTINGSNMFNNNGNTGLNVNSLGAIKVNNVMANENIGSGYGAYLLNSITGSVNQPITLTGYGIFNNNSSMGLGVFSHGTVTLANLSASNNIDGGVNIDTENNASATSVANVTITGANTFNGNGGHGLYIYSDGAITLSNITANDNTGKGAWLDNLAYANVGLTGIKNITVNGSNMFSNNGSDGLYFQATGTVSLMRITANLNMEAGGPIANGVLGTTFGAINITCGSMYGNEGAGYDLSAGVGKVITIKGVLNFGNGLGDGASPTPIIIRTCPLP